MRGGRPLRFLALTLGGWVAIRIALLLPDPVSLSKTDVPTPKKPARAMPPTPVAVAALAARLRADPHTPFHAPIVVASPPAYPSPRSAEGRSPMLPSSSIQSPITNSPPRRPRPSPFMPPAPGSTSGRFGGSVWLLARGGVDGTVSGGQLGASQGGVRVTYALDDARRLALSARLATPLRGAGREAALGVEWRPTDLPIRLIAEQRFALDGGRGGPTLGVIGGYGPADIAGGVQLEAYGQAGAIGRSGIEGFVDASARLVHPVARVAGMRFDMGVGAWGSAQRAVARLDVGPSIAVVLPVERRNVRLTLDWRRRVAGDARPGSGPALSIGSDF